VERIGAPAVTYQSGRDLAARFIDMAGGVMGSKAVRIVAADPGGDSAAAVIAVEELKKQGVTLFMGGLVADATLAAARAAAPSPFLAIDARLPVAVVRDVPNLFQIGPSAEALGRVLAAEAARSPAVRWGVVAQDDYFGRALAHAFWDALRTARPEVELAMESYVPTLSGQVGPALDTLSGAAPDGLLLGLRDGDLVAFVRAARGGLLAATTVMVPQVGTPDMLGALGTDLPDGWVTTGYPCCETGGQPHRAFAEAYRTADPNGATPTITALYGYTAMITVATALDSAWSEKPEALTKELAGLTLSTPVGEMYFARETRQSTLPVWVGRTLGGRFIEARRVDPSAHR